MPVGNQQLWDQGIGGPATSMLSGDIGRQPSNFNPMALSNQNNSGQISEPTVETPVPATPAQPAQAAQQQPQQQQQGNNPYANQIQQAQLEMQQLQQQYSLAMDEGQRRKIQYRMQQALKKLHMWQAQNAKW